MKGCMLLWLSWIGMATSFITRCCVDVVGGGGGGGRAHRGDAEKASVGNYECRNV